MNVAGRIGEFILVMLEVMVLVTFYLYRSVMPPLTLNDPLGIYFPAFNTR